MNPERFITRKRRKLSFSSDDRNSVCSVTCSVRVGIVLVLRVAIVTPGISCLGCYFLFIQDFTRLLYLSRPKTLAFAVPFSKCDFFFCLFVCLKPRLILVHCLSTKLAGGHVDVQQCE